MPSNIEIKAVLLDWARVETAAAQLSDAAPEVIHQEDIFFHCDGARLSFAFSGPRAAN